MVVVREESILLTDNGDQVLGEYTEYGGNDCFGWLDSDEEVKIAAWVGVETGDLVCSVYVGTIEILESIRLAESGFCVIYVSEDVWVVLAIVLTELGVENKQDADL